MVTPMPPIDPARHFSIRPSRPAVQRARDEARAGIKTHRAHRKLEKATAKATHRADRNAPEAAAISPAELREREHDLRTWWSLNAEPHASRLKEHELEAFYAGCRAHIVDRTLDHSAWRELCAAFKSATTPPAEPDPNYWRHHGRHHHVALPDGW
jgi:hypothetical protein